MTDLDAAAHLQSLALQSDEHIDLARTAVVVSLSCGSLSRKKYLNHIKVLSNAVAKRYQALLEGGGQDDIRTRLAALKHILSDEHDYHLDSADGEILENADLARVIERRKGNATAIALLYLHVARSQSWAIAALSFPGYTLCRMEEGSERLIFDAARQCRLMQAPDLRALVKKILGEKAELSADYFEPLSNREFLIRLQNAIKTRLIEMGDYARALEVVEKMRLIHPTEYRLFLDAGVLYAKTQKPAEAIPCLEAYIKRAPNGRDREEAMMLLYDIKSKPMA